MKKNWTKQDVFNAVESNGGETYFLVDEFPFSEEDKAIIEDWYESEEMTDSDVCDAIVNLALNKCNN